MATVMLPTIEPYTLLRAALALYQKAPTELDPKQLRRAEIQALNEYDLENKVLNTVEASSVIISDVEVERALNEIKARFENEDEFIQQLSSQQLSFEQLYSALHRQCKVNSVLERVAARAPQISDVEVGIYYHSHPEHFNVPERRLARHILISINPDYPENTRANSLQRIEAIATTLKVKPSKFAEMALRHSECPTAMNQGELGKLTRGKLYPELDAALFQLKLHEISGVVETEMGFHLIQCMKIFPAKTLSLKRATPKIRQVMRERSKQACQKAWLAQLKSNASAKHS